MGSPGGDGSRAMGRTASLDTIWPADGDPKTLLCVRVPCSAAELFKTVFVDPELQVLRMLTLAQLRADGRDSKALRSNF